MDQATTQAHLTRLEIGLAHQQRLCEQLNEVVTSQTRSIMQLERAIGQLKKQFAELQSERKQDARGEPDQEKPPHY